MKSLTHRPKETLNYGHCAWCMHRSVFWWMLCGEALRFCCWLCLSPRPDHHFFTHCRKPSLRHIQIGECRRRKHLRSGNMHSADDWENVLKPGITRDAGRNIPRLFQPDAAFALPTLYTTLEGEGYFYTIRLPTNALLQRRFAHLLKRPVGRPPSHVRRLYGDFEYQAGSWDTPRRLLAKIEWHPGELFPRVGFLVTNRPLEPEQVFGIYNQRGTAEQYIKEVKIALKWTCLSCKSMAQNEVRLLLHALAYKLGSFLQAADLPEGSSPGHS